MFYHLLHIKTRKARDVLYEVFGTEEETVGSKPTLADDEALDPQDLPTGAPSVATLSLLKCINPFKWVEGIVALLYWGVDELCQLGLEDGTKLTSANLFRIMARFLVFSTLGLIAGLVKYISSPYNQIIKPIMQSLEEDDTAMSLLIVSVALGVFAIGLICVISVFTGGAPLIPLLVAGLSYAAQALAGWLGGSAAAMIAVNVLVSIATLTISQAIVQKIFNLGNIVKDFWYGIMGRGGYDPSVSNVDTVAPANDEADSPTTPAGSGLTGPAAGDAPQIPPKDTQRPKVQDPVISPLIEWVNKTYDLNLQFRFLTFGRQTHKGVFYIDKIYHDNSVFALIKAQLPEDPENVQASTTQEWEEDDNDLSAGYKIEFEGETFTQYLTECQNQGKPPFKFPSHQEIAAWLIGQETLAGVTAESQQSKADPKDSVSPVAEGMKASRKSTVPHAPGSTAPHDALFHPSSSAAHSTNAPSPEPEVTNVHVTIPGSSE